MSASLPQDRFFGTYRHTVDTKHRVTVPSRWRDGELEELFALEDDGLGILKLLPRGEMERTGQEVLTMQGMSRAEARDFRRYIYSRAVLCPVDKQGRVGLPGALVAQLGLGPEVLLVGVGERIEVWDPEKWEQVRADQAKRFQALSKEIGF